MDNKHCFNILISSAGRRVVLVREFRKALRRLRLAGKVVAIDISNTAPALYAADTSYIVPRLNDPSYMDAFMEIVKKEKVDVVIPTIDPELPLYASVKEKIESETGARIMVSSPEVVNVCSDKIRFYTFMREHGIPTPSTFMASEHRSMTFTFPLFAKPRSGFASVNTFTIADNEDLSYVSRKYGDIIFQEFIRGREYTIDLLSDLNGRVISVVPRERLEVRGGEVTRSRTEKNATIMEMAGKIAAALGATGPITLQCIVKDEVPYFFEINPRVGGGLPASIAAGANTPQMIIRMCRGETPMPVIGRFKNNHYMMRYDDALCRSGLLPGARRRGG